MGHEEGADGLVYVPQDAAAYERMVRFFSNCGSREELQVAMLVYFTDLSYPRPDLLMAIRETCKAKGWPLW